MKKIILFIAIIFLSFSCATQEKYVQHRKQQSLMILKNTDMHKNKKYHERSYQKHIKHNRIKNNYKR
jgi:hypothetical protein